MKYIEYKGGNRQKHNESRCLCSGLFIQFVDKHPSVAGAYVSISAAVWLYQLYTADSFNK